MIALDASTSARQIISKHRRAEVCNETLARNGVGGVGAKRFPQFVEFGIAGKGPWSEGERSKIWSCLHTRARY